MGRVVVQMDFDSASGSSIWDPGCALCRGRAQEDEHALRVELAPEPSRTLGVQDADRASHEDSVRLAPADFARAPPRLA